MIQYIEAKSILSKLQREDTWFGITYNMNLYRGCQHGCIYCDTRSECYGIAVIIRKCVTYLDEVSRNEILQLYQRKK